MINKVRGLFFTMAMLGLLFASTAWTAPAVEHYIPPSLPTQLSSDGKMLYNGNQPVIMVDRPKPYDRLRRIPPPVYLVNHPETATATFTITYLPAGSSDPWEETCFTFPEEAKAAFNAAAAIWGSLLQSSVPITISACWANLGSSTLGYSGGGYSHRNFTGAPLTNTWYSASLANALHGSDLISGYEDMHITYNSNFSWYYGIDGNPPLTQHDLMTVVLHEIGHGLNFSGKASYSAGQGNLGSSGSPGIYDTFMRDGSGTLLTSYTSPSVTLGSVLTSGDLWFHGSNAMAANGGERVKVYAPSQWRSGSSYSHLDYDTFSNTANQMMVYAISAGESIHDPGTVTKGLLKDLGWPSYAQQFGSLTVTISPQGVVDAGAQWRRTGTTTWFNSGDTETGLPVGSYTVEFKSITGWTTPSSAGVTISNGQMATASGTYAQQFGSLNVTISPQGVVDAGAQWRRTGTMTWINSGATETGIPVGFYTVEFKSVTGWPTPPPVPVMISMGEMTYFAGIYAPTSVSPSSLVVVRGADDSLWKAICAGLTCSAFTSFPGLFGSQPTVYWDENIQRYVLWGRASNDTIWRSTFDRFGNFNNDWTGMPGLTSSPVGAAGGGLANNSWHAQRSNTITLNPGVATNIISDYVYCPWDGYVIATSTGDIQHDRSSSSGDSWSRVYLAQTSGGTNTRWQFTDMPNGTPTGITSVPYSTSANFSCPSGGGAKYVYVTGEAGGTAVATTTTTVQWPSLTLQYFPYHY